jgi:hypothetical protein
VKHSFSHEQQKSFTGLMIVSITRTAIGFFLQEMGWNRARREQKRKECWRLFYLFFITFEKTHERFISLALLIVLQVIGR